MKSNVWNEKMRGDWVESLRLPFLVMILLLLAGGIGILLPKVLPRADNIIGRIGTVDSAFLFSELAIGTLFIMALIIFLRQDEFAATAVMAASIMLDWYLHINFVALLMALALLLIFFLARSPRYPWVAPPALWLWVLFLLLIIFAAIRGSLTTYEILYFYNYITFGAFIMFWLGAVLARNMTSVRRFFLMLTGFGTLIAIHALIQAVTGTFLFWTSLNDYNNELNNNFVLAIGYDTVRVGSFLLNPDWSGPFFAFMLLITLGLLVESTSLAAKILYIIEVSLMVGALLVTYTYGAWIGFGVGIFILVIFIGRTGYRVMLCVILFIFAVAFVVFFPVQLQLSQLRADDSLIRFGAWQTALRVINAFPLIGIGLGQNNYLVRAEPYRVIAQYIPLVHPLNSYLEFAAEGGIPVLLAFVALLGFALWLAFRNWSRADARTRALLAGCIAAVISLSVDSMTNNIWTLPPLATLGWLVLGVISSPLFSRELNHQVAKVQNP
jgi:O-Antigen ligase